MSQSVLNGTREIQDARLESFLAAEIESGAEIKAGADKPARALKIVRIGLLGLGRVGQAVARLCEAARETLRARGLDLRVAGALVRDEHKPRAFRPRGALVTSREKHFLARPYDVVIEVLGGVEPARALVTHFLRHGTPVVTANKSLLAACGEALFELARQSATPLRGEAGAVAGVPFLATLQNRPLFARVERIAAILNGTSNFILSEIAARGVSFEDALRDAQQRGFAEPDAARDVNGTDAAEKLVVLLQHLGVCGVKPEHIETAGIQDVTAADLRQARAWGGAIKPAAYAARNFPPLPLRERAGVRVSESTETFGKEPLTPALSPEGREGKTACPPGAQPQTWEAFIGPAFVETGHPLAGVENESNGVRLQGRALGDVFFGGPGAGPDITAATILDDVTEIITQGFQPPARWFAPHEIGEANTALEQKTVCRAPHTGWFVRLDFPQAAPAFDHLCEFLGSYGVWFRRFSESATHAENRRVYGLTHPCRRELLETALAALRTATGCEALSLRVLENSAAADAQEFE